MEKDKLTLNQEHYINARMEGLTQRQAYRRAYPRSQKWTDKAADEAACVLEASKKVSQRLAELKAAAAKKAVWNRARAAESLLKLHDVSLSTLEKEAGYVERLTASERLKVDKEARLGITDSVDRLNILFDIRPESADADARPFVADFGLMLGRSFVDIHRDIHDHKYTDYAFKGGRGSLKSSTISLEIPKLMMSCDDYNAVVLRKVGKTLRNSALSQLWWAICALGLDGEFTKTVSPMEITRKSTGQRIFLLGLDDQEKVRSLKPQRGYVAIQWFEEYHQFTPEEVRSAKQSLSRGGDVYWRFYSWNPPRSKSSWVNEWVTTDEPGRIVHESCYLDAPREWLGEQFFADAEALKAINEDAYRHEYLGEAIGTDGDVFTNVVLREITDDEIAEMAYIRCGTDWGYKPDPWVFGRVGYDSKTKTVYILDELYGTTLSDEQTAAKVKQLLSEPDANGNPIFNQRAPYNRVYCDSAEPKSVASWRTLGINALAVKKWPGSVEAGIKGLQTRAAIVIDPRRAPLSATEFVQYQYEDDGAGGLKAYADKDNHSIDKARYALAEKIINRKET